MKHNYPRTLKLDEPIPFDFTELQFIFRDDKASSLNYHYKLFEDAELDFFKKEGILSAYEHLRVLFDFNMREIDGPICVYFEASSSGVAYVFYPKSDDRMKLWSITKGFMYRI